MTRQNVGKVLILLCLLFQNSDCKVTGTVSTTIPPSTTAHPPYPGCGVKLDREFNASGIGGSIVGGTVVAQGAFPWMAFLYNFDR